MRVQAHIRALEPAEAPSGAREILEDLRTRRGDVGPMVRAMAHSPALLRGYLELSRAMKRAKLPRSVSEKVSLAVQEWIGCDVCLEAHSHAARAAGLSETDLVLARQGTAADSAEAALVAFAVRVLAEPSALTDRDLVELRDHGWSDRAIADVVGLVALNQLTGSFNLVAGLRPASDDAARAALKGPHES